MINEKMLTVDIPLKTPKLDLISTLGRIAKFGQWVSLRQVLETTHTRTARDGKTDDNLVFFDRGVMIEVLINGNLAYAGTSDLSPLGIERAAEKAAALARAGAGHQVFNFHQELRPVNRGQHTSSRLQDLDQVDLKNLTDFLFESTHTMKVSEKISSSTSLANFIQTESHYVSTSGHDLSQSFLITSAQFAVIASEGHESQTRSLMGPRGISLQAGPDSISRFATKDSLRKVGQEAVQLLTAENCPSQTCDLILLPNQMLIQIHESIGHPLEMDRILGDERNFAGWSFVQPEDFGKLQYGSSLMNITFDPTVSEELASYAYDDSGAKAERQYLIQKGRLLRGLGASESQWRMKKPGVANFRAASWNRAPIDRMANLNLEPGSTSLPEMISQVEDGILMEANISWSIDDYRDKFQFGCEIGRVIKNGKITGLVKNPNYRGRTLAFWHGLKAVGKAEESFLFGSPFCGKGEPSQCIRVGHASPPCLFEKVEVFGGGQ